MRRFLIIVAVAVLLSACAPAALTSTPPTLPPVSTQVPASTPVPAPTMTPSPAPSATPSATPAPTATEAQDCGGEPVCILDGHFLFQRPIGSIYKQTIERSYPYGSSQGGTREIHHGVEFYNAQGTPILGAADGKVIFAGNDKLTLLSWVTGYYGNVVVIEHHFPGIPGPVYTLYGHQYKVDVTTGQDVKAGQQIGLVGATGTAAGSHLHFEVRLRNNDYKSNRNPELWLMPLPGNGTLAGRIEDASGNLLKGTVNIQSVENGVPNSVPVAYAQTYDNGPQPINADDVYRENFVIGDLPAGDYRLTLLANGNLYEQMIKIEAGKLTLVKFVVR